MSYEVTIAHSQARAKVRKPWGVIGLTFITLGVYHIFWWYFVNRELRDLGRAKGVSGLGEHPGLSCVAAWLGAWTLYIATVGTYVAGTKRVQRAQQLVGCEDRVNGWLMLALAIFTLGIGAIVYYQRHLNRVWERMDVVPSVSALAAASEFPLPINVQQPS
jgi:hypothetical protein